MTVSAYSTTASLNTAINGINIGEGMSRANVNNAIRELMADIKSWSNSFTVTYPLSIANGGTGAATAGAAFNAISASGGTVGAAIKMTGAGAYPHFASTSVTDPKIHVQASGSDPTANPGDLVFEY
jgi:hypothetical protein